MIKLKKLFYITHWLHLIYYLFLFLHAKNFWKWMVGPFALVILERIVNFYRFESVKYGETFIKDVCLLSSKVYKQKLLIKSVEFHKIVFFKGNTTSNTSPSKF